VGGANSLGEQGRFYRWPGFAGATIW